MVGLVSVTIIAKLMGASPDPYDVYNREEACREVAREPLSFLKIDRAETQFDSSVDTYAPEVYAKAKELLENAIADGTFIKDSEQAYYIYACFAEAADGIGSPSRFIVQTDGKHIGYMASSTAIWNIHAFSSSPTAIGRASCRERVCLYV